MPVGQLNSEHRVRKSFNNCALDLDDAVFAGHKLTYLLLRDAPETREKPREKIGIFRAETPRLNLRTNLQEMVVKDLEEQA